MGTVSRYFLYCIGGMGCIFLAVWGANKVTEMRLEKTGPVMQAIKYEMVEAGNTDILSEKVTSLLAEGWELVGDFSCSQSSSKLVCKQPLLRKECFFEKTKETVGCNQFRGPSRK